MIEPLKLEPYHCYRAQSGFAGDGSFGGGGYADDNAWGVIANKLNEIIDVVNAMQSDIAFRSILKSVSSVDFMPPTGADIGSLFEERQRLAQSIHVQTFGLGDPEE